MPIFRYPFFYNPNYYNRFDNHNIYNHTENHNLRNNQHNFGYTNSNNMNKVQNNNDYNYKTSSRVHPNSNSSYNYNSNSNSQPVDNRVSDSGKKNNSKSNDSSENYFFELFGLKLYFDDILLICLIFFLYQEGVKDDELFLSLVLSYSPTFLGYFVLGPVPFVFFI